MPTSSVEQCIVTYLDVGPPVPLGASGDEKSTSHAVTGDPAGSVPANTHFFQVFFEGASPCLLRPHLVSSAVFWHPVHCLSLCSLRTWPAVFLLLVVKMFRVAPCLPSSSPLHLWNDRAMRCLGLYVGRGVGLLVVYPKSDFSPKCLYIVCYFLYSCHRMTNGRKVTAKSRSANLFWLLSIQNWRRASLWS